MTGEEMAARLLMSAAFGTLVGIERQWRHKTAGLKTNALVSVGATAFGLIALISFGPGSNPTQIAAGVVTGIGFIGAGVIMHRGASVQGINTAATLWAAAGMGLAIGQGAYQLSSYILGTVLLVQFSLQWAANYINKRSGLKPPVAAYHLVIVFNPTCAEAVRKAWGSFAAEPGVTVTSYDDARTDQVETIDALIGLGEDRVDAAASVSQTFAGIDGVVHTYCKRISGSDGE